ncbi:RNA-binding S4 domain-containing protein [Mesorhizobium liriopis]|uniref:RNA-binding S4 domain-containing protein n=1 Tax=Mesorhizobium liriopis TaxID=2953882 RepID=UPI00338E52ED
MPGEGRQRIDKWLFFARLVKSRSLGAKLVELGRVRINRRKAEKPSDAVHVGDVLTLNLDRRIAVLRVLDLGERRGPAPEAQGLYEDLAPEEAQTGDGEGRVHFPDAAPALRRAKRGDPVGGTLEDE